MATDVDIIVTGPDTTEVRLIAEAKLFLSDIASAEKSLKEAMLRMSSPVGLLVTPERLWVYLDRYLSQTPESVDKVGEFDVSPLLRFKPDKASSDEAHRFETTVQHWLEDLPQSSTQIHREDSRLWNVLSAYVLPAVETGRIRAAAPRYRS